jgi:hypothetical protein
MSVQINQYLILGTKLAFRKDNRLEGSELDIDQEAFADMVMKYQDSAYKGIEHHNGLCILDDGMNGQFTLVGRVLKKSSEGEMLSGPFGFNIGSASASSGKNSKDESAEDNEYSYLVPIVTELIQAQFKIAKPDVKLWFVTYVR